MASTLSLSLSCTVTLVILLLSFSNSFGREYRGEVIDIADGDTITMRAGNNRKMKIRLAQIDAPEKRQPYGSQSKAFLAMFLGGQSISVQKTGNDKYGRTVGTIYRRDDGANICEKMVKEGNAWAYRAYLQDTSLIALEEAARGHRIGLWKLPSESWIPPWEWRKQKNVDKDLRY